MIDQRHLGMWERVSNLDWKLVRENILEELTPELNVER